ncbi:raffinose/stachyose/melibiose transport system permease protein [Paenibacillus baekrokdamisoli]|nr:carbohydrate ABC transporter permease [Paenibacillus baekrokdamisoli]MBB3072043.1 raffinose/stachyose/melibiose transport system permease protein [Paenibacillus baekrokdamisoli]
MNIKRKLMWLLLSVLLVTQLYPLLWLLLYSLKTNEEILTGGILRLPKVFQWSNYHDAIFSGNYLQYLTNSIFITGVTLVCTLALGSMASYAIARFDWKWGNAMLLLFIIGMMIPLQSTLLPLVVVFKKLHILDSYISLLLPYIAFALPIAVFILATFFKSIPREMEESASIDGASVNRTFFSIILPLTVPPLTTVTILTFIPTWNEYIMAATFISTDSLKTLPFGVYSFVGKYTTNFGAIGAYLVLASLPVILVYFLLSEKIAKGMVAGAVKG